MGSAGSTFHLNGSRFASVAGVNEEPLRFVGNFANARFAKLLDDLRVYRVALTSTEIPSLHGSGTGTPPARPLPALLSATAYKDQPFNYSVPASDAASFSAANLPVGLGFDSTSGSITGTPARRVSNSWKSTPPTSTAPSPVTSRCA